MGRVEFSGDSLATEPQMPRPIAMREAAEHPVIGNGCVSPSPLHAYPDVHAIGMRTNLILPA
jgi:hypothetical protein